jgi:hypothetical protein
MDVDGYAVRLILVSYYIVPDRAYQLMVGAELEQLWPSRGVTLNSPKIIF